MKTRYIGLMSGTSLDAIDAVLVDIGDQVRLLHHCSHPIPDPIRNASHALNHSSDSDLQRSLELDRQWGYLFAEAVNTLLATSSTDAATIRAIGCHGQTVRHAPAGSHGYTLQIGDPNTVAELTGIDVVADFRRRDIAAGGQGAPLACGFHQAVFASTQEQRAIINIGGMANITWLGHETVGFDTGPGNVLMDIWASRHLQTRFDGNGQWAASGQVIPPLLQAMLADPYFSLPPPKSTGREHFDQHWLDRHLQGNEVPADVQATLAELTARSICDALPAACQALYICGGGAANQHLMTRLASISQRPVADTGSLGVDPDWLEAMAFAWLASRTIAGLPGNIPGVTGAAGPRILGAIFQA